MEAKIISYRIPREFEFNQQNLKPIDGHRENIKFLDHPQAVNTMRQDLSQSESPSAKLAPADNMIAVGVEQIRTSPPRHGPSSRYNEIKQN